MAYILISEISKKQNYIFKSNRLAENIGASFIVKHITEELPQKYLKDSNGKEIYEGGGKSLYLFENKESAAKFTKMFSRHVIEYFPGVELFITGHSFDNETEDVIEVIDEVYKKLAIKKAERRNNVGMIGLGITKLCYSTNLPAFDYNIKRRNSLISREIKVKLEYSEKALNEFKDIEIEGYKFPKELDELGRSENEKSYIAVIHIDGNKMGKKIENLKEKYKKQDNETFKEHNQKYLAKIKEFSKEIKSAYITAFKKMNQFIVDNFNVLLDKLDLKENMLPIRPLILAGDDVCFVCDARIAIECSKVFIEELNRYQSSEGRLHACAGISIVKSHYPFAKAYELAEQLCKNAKNEIKDEDASLIDWHISQGEISDSIYSIREKHYRISNGGNYTLNMRPLYLDSKKSWRSFKNFEEAIKIITSEKIPRNKIKELRKIMREGKERTELFIKANRLDSYIYRFENVSGNYGFTDDNRCMYYDAIETMDFYLGFKEVK